MRGQVVRRGNKMALEHPEIFYPCSKYEEKLGTLQPKYPLTNGITNNAVMKAVRQAVEHMELSVDKLPYEARLKYELAEYNYAVRGIHFPEDKEVFYRARERLVFDEFLAFILSVRKLRAEKERLKNQFQLKRCKETEELLQKLPYELTKAQQRVWEEIEQDMKSGYSMSRLVQGDVGSGKTIVAVLALLLAACNGCQGAMMAPTEEIGRAHV